MSMHFKRADVYNSEGEVIGFCLELYTGPVIAPTERWSPENFKKWSESAKLGRDK